MCQLSDLSWVEKERAAGTEAAIYTAPLRGGGDIAFCPVSLRGTATLHSVPGACGLACEPTAEKLGCLQQLLDAVRLCGFVLRYAQSRELQGPKGLPSPRGTYILVTEEGLRSCF